MDDCSIVGGSDGSNIIKILSELDRNSSFFELFPVLDLKEDMMITQRNLNKEMLEDLLADKIDE